MIIKFLFNSTKILIIWLVIGIIAALAYKHIKPYYNNVIPVIKNQFSSVKPALDDLSLSNTVGFLNHLNKTEAKSTQKNLKEISSAAITKINELTDKISSSPKPVITQKNKKPVVALSPKISNTSSKEEIIDRQLSILNELMK
jgi:hypothetical protein